ncbi:hypothetical protein PM082_002259 [Marasmius tenuissimus]|nr:hypothetical protein PM082_002259 [Marasmius tenuissimus]
MSPPEEELQDLVYLQIVRYSVVSAFTIFVWDVVYNLYDDYRLLLSGGARIGWPTLVYVFTRLLTFTGLVLTILFFLAPMGSRCHHLNQALFGGFPAFVTSESLLLFFRVRAIFITSRPITLFFLVSLLIVTASSTLIPLALSGDNIPGTDYCVITKLNRPFATVLLLVPLANHITVFIAISYRLLQYSQPAEGAEQDRQRFCRPPGFIARRNALPLLTRTLVKDGQIYILTFIATTLITAVLMSIDSVPDAIHYILIPPHIVIENCMNGYLFRHVREAADRERAVRSLGELNSSMLQITNHDTNIDTTVSECVFAGGERVL